MVHIDLSIVIPAYNESSRLPNTLIDIQKYIAEHPEMTIEVLVVNDGSKDDMVDKLTIMQETFPQLKVIGYAQNQGKGYATRTGMLAAQGNYVVFMDADNSTNIREYDGNKHLLDQYDIIIGSRNLPTSDVHIEKKHRTLISRVSNLLIRVVLGITIRDTQCGFKIFPGKYVKQIFSRQTINRFGFDMEIIMIAQAQKLSVIEFPVRWVESADSKVHPVKDTLRTFRELVVIKSNLLKGRYN
jgi:glycosyltransferase involved in cell wall biosynthesis